MAEKVQAYAYCRVSGRGQIDGDGFDRQLLAIQAFASRNGYQIFQVFREEGVSGERETDGRPALLELIEAASKHRVKVLFIEKLDRLARDLLVQESILGDLKRNGLTLVSALEPDLCSNDPSRKLMRQMMGAFAEYEKNMLVLKLRGARQRRSKKLGRTVEGRKPFGSFPGESATIARMKALKAGGKNLEMTARILENEGFKPRSGAVWHAAVIGRILRRER